MNREMMYEQERLLLQSQESIAEAIERSGLKRSELAQKLGKDRSFVTQALSTGRNLTLSSLASLLWAAGFRLEQRIVALPKADASPETHALHIVPVLGCYESSSPEPTSDTPERDTDAFGSAA
jgi:ribosome-binding protein aMBF1 (putative translation factor)